jgi:hypothetical protein
MSKFKVQVKLQGYEVKLGSIEFTVEGEKEDAQKISQEIEKQLGGMIHGPNVLAPTAITSGNGNSNQRLLEGQVGGDSNEAEKRKRARKPGKPGGTKISADDLNLSHDPEKFGSPQQEWTQAQKAVWFLHVVGEQAHVTQQTSYSVTKNFNRYFKSSGQLNSANVMRGLEKERSKNPATVNANMSDGTARYFLTTAGKALAGKLATGEAVTD